MSDITHKQVVRRIANWLKNTKRQTVVISELSTKLNETPDVISWIGHAHSTLVEVKISRNDFWADKEKIFRMYEDSGMGDLRYFATPEGLLKESDLPEGWGLLEIREHSIRELIPAKPKQANKQAECTMLMSVLRRLELSTAVYVVSEEQAETGNKEEEKK